MGCRPITCSSIRVNTQQNADIWLSLNIYDTLIQPTLDGVGIQPALAESWTVSADGKTVTLKIRPGLKFADGSPLELSDIKWSLDRASKKETGGGFQFLLNSIQSVEIAGADTVVLHLSQPDPSILEALATFNAGILPEKLLMAAAGKDLAEKSKNFAEHPIGSGPFMVTSWSRGNEMLLSRNPHYWGRGADGKPLPYLDHLHMVTIPDDATRILKLKAGELGWGGVRAVLPGGGIEGGSEAEHGAVPGGAGALFQHLLRPDLQERQQEPR